MLVDELRKIVPNLVITGGQISDDMPDLHRGELEIVAFAGAKRQLEFAHGRLFAHQALAELGHDIDVISRDEYRAPVWPDPVVGSISHTRDYAVAVVSDRSRYRSLGIDVELMARLNPATWRVVFTDNELDYLKNLPPEIQQARATTIFSAKEAFYKCDFPLNRKNIGFKNIEMQETDEPGHMAISCDRLTRRKGYHCRYSRDDSHVITIVYADFRV